MLKLVFSLVYFRRVSVVQPLSKSEALKKVANLILKDFNSSLFPVPKRPAKAKTKKILMRKI